MIIPMNGKKLKWRTVVIIPFHVLFILFLFYFSFYLTSSAKPCIHTFIHMTWHTQNIHICGVFNNKKGTNSITYWLHWKLGRWFLIFISIWCVVYIEYIILSRYSNNNNNNIKCTCTYIWVNNIKSCYCIILK